MNKLNIFTSLINICGLVAAGDYESAKVALELHPGAGADDSGKAVLKAFSLMLLGVESREYELKRILERRSQAQRILKQYKEKLALDNRKLRAKLRKHNEDMRPVALDPIMQPLMHQAQRTAKTNVNLLISGETGSGKGMLARYIHGLSSRAGKPFIAVNCSAIPANLLESELFGIEAGVASGVQKRMGRFEQAIGGTIYLEEICDLPLSSQPKILNIIETGTLERVGGRRSIPVDVRIIAASHRNIERLVEQGAFRSDLFHSLNAIRLHVPPLRERKQDILILVRLILAQIAEKAPFAVTDITPEALDRLINHDWPGNIGELSNELERAALLAEESSIVPDNLSPVLGGAPLFSQPLGENELETIMREGNILQLMHNGSLPSNILSLENAETIHIRNVIELVSGNKTRAAKLLNISREGLRIKLKAMGYEG